MSTRGAFGFHSDKQDKIGYSHCDSYPEGLGKTILEFISKETLESLQKISNNIVLVSNESTPTENQIKECQNWTNLGVSGQTVDDWYCLLREAQGDLQAYKDGLKYMLDSQSFLLDSLFCEYAYIINTDNISLEFYSGFNQKLRSRKGRYSNAEKSNQSNSYYGVVLIKKYSLLDIIGSDNEKINSIVSNMEDKADSFYNNQEKELKRLVVK
jgi:hypothetical protein